MRILMIVSNSFAPDVRVEKEAVSLAKAGHEVSILAWDRLDEKPEYKYNEKVFVRRIGPCSRYNSRMNALKLPQFWAKVYWHVLWSKDDVIHCHDFDTFPPGLLAAKLRLRPKKVVYDAHEDYGALHPRTKWFVNAFEKMFCRFATVITVNELLAKKYKKAAVILNCARLEYYTPLLLNKLSDKFTIVYIGGLQKNRGLEEMVVTVNGIEDVELFIYGKGLLEEELKALAGPRIHFGFIRPDEVPMYTLAADLLFALYTGGGNNRVASPNKLFEAMAAGKPMLVTDAGIMGGIVRKFGMGVVVELHGDCDETYRTLTDAINKVRANYAEMSEGATKASKVFNWENEAKKLIETYKSL